MENIRGAIKQLDQSSNIILSISTEQLGGAMEQATTVSEVSATFEQIAAMARQIQEQAHRVEGVSRNTLEACDRGTELLKSSVEGFERIFDQGQTVSTFMENLEVRFQEMFRIIELIEDISEQTEMLALNAALEAAGAGEAGRRFSVVAKATRRLANQVAGAASEIRNTIDTIQGATKQAAEAASQGQVTAQEEKKLIDDTASAIGKISELARDTSNAVKEITLSTKQQTSATEMMAGSMGEVTEISSSSAEGAKEIDKTVKKLTNLMDSLKNLVEGRKR
jgi:methyl-accepting chemotaxis protein